MVSELMLTLLYRQLDALSYRFEGIGSSATHRTLLSSEGRDVVTHDGSAADRLPAQTIKQRYGLEYDIVVKTRHLV